LSQAAEKGDEGVVKLLLESGAQPDFEDQNSQTPLSRAVEGGTVAILLAGGAKTNYKYKIVSHFKHISTVLYSMADTVILGYCRK
jgi:ankyrin repeat protein